MRIVVVDDESTAREFIQLPVSIYQNNPTWIRPLDKDIDQVFDPKSNKSYRHGEAIRWLAIDDTGKTHGRLAAFVNNKTAKKGNEQPTGGIGFFECRENKQVAFLLFDEAKKWLEERGMEAMDGPINFGERDKWWGLLVDGFDIEPNYNCNYNPSYYREFFEEYGFEIYFKQFTYGRKVQDPFHPKLYNKAKKIMQEPGYHFCHLKRNDLDKYTEDFRVVYNAAWAGHSGVAGLSSLQAKHIMKQMTPILDERIIWFGYFNDEPVAFYINLPEVNQIFKHVNGKLNLWGKLIFLFHKYAGTCHKMLGLVFGVVPANQGKGLEGALVIATAEMVQKKYTRYKDLEMNWIGDFNPKMMRVVEQVGGEIVKTHHTYRKLFDETKEFKRARIQ